MDAVDALRSPQGLTYNSHPVGLATAEAVIEVMKADKIVEHAAKMGERVKGHFAQLKAKHPSFKEGRVIGLFSMVGATSCAAVLV